MRGRELVSKIDQDAAAGPVSDDPLPHSREEKSRLRGYVVAAVIRSMLLYQLVIVAHDEKRRGPLANELRLMLAVGKVKSEGHAHRAECEAKEERGRGLRRDALDAILRAASTEAAPVRPSAAGFWLGTDLIAGPVVP